MCKRYKHLFFQLLQFLIPLCVYMFQWIDVVWDSIHKRWDNQQKMKNMQAKKEEYLANPRLFSTNFRFRQNGFSTWKSVHWILCTWGSLFTLIGLHWALSIYSQRKGLNAKVANVFSLGHRRSLGVAKLSFIFFHFLNIEFCHVFPCINISYSGLERNDENHISYFYTSLFSRFGSYTNF